MSPGGADVLIKCGTCGLAEHSSSPRDKGCIAAKELPAAAVAGLADCGVGHTGVSEVLRLHFLPSPAVSGSPVPYSHGQGGMKRFQRAPELNFSLALLIGSYKTMVKPSPYLDPSLLSVKWGYQFLLFCRAGDGTQSLPYARQVPYY